MKQHILKPVGLGLALLATAALSYTARAQASLLTLRGGYQHASILDQQANPIIHQANGPALGLGYERLQTNAYWEVGLSMSLQDMQVKNKDLRWKPSELTTTSATLSLRYAHPILHTDGGSLWLGGVLQQDVIVDFEGVGDFPWLFGQGAISPELSWKQPVAQAGQFSVSAGAPLMGWLIDMPYHQVPRVEGEVPGVSSILQKGTRLVWWNTYQRFHARVEYQHTFSDQWSAQARYDFLWWHDALPKDFWGYQGLATIGISRQL
ncbi:MAG: hypothetical protein AAFQ98_20080 [Bacteroidota bacterium]